MKQQSYNNKPSNKYVTDWTPVSDRDYKVIEGLYRDGFTRGNSIGKMNDYCDICMEVHEMLIIDFDTMWCPIMGHTQIVLFKEDGTPYKIKENNEKENSNI